MFFGAQKKVFAIIRPTDGELEKGVVNMDSETMNNLWKSFKSELKNNGWVDENGVNLVPFQIYHGTYSSDGVDNLYLLGIYSGHINN